MLAIFGLMILFVVGAQVVGEWFHVWDDDKDKARRIHSKWR